MTLRALLAAALLALASPAFALNIVLSNDDGLTSNLAALYEALKAAGHDVIVSVPCTGQSGRGAAIVMYSTIVIVPDNDKSQIEAEDGCHNDAAPIGAPAVGPFTKAGYTNGDFHYVHGTPVMATMYGLDVLAEERWGKAPDVVLSGPNEGQNVGLIVNSSGTVGNVQFAAGRGLPAIALSAGTDTVDNTDLADPDSVIVAGLTVKLLNELEAKARHGHPLLPDGVALNVNFPNAAKPDSAFAFSHRHFPALQSHVPQYPTLRAWLLVERSWHGHVLASAGRSGRQRDQGLRDGHAGELRPQPDRSALAAPPPAPVRRHAP